MGEFGVSDKEATKNSSNSPSNVVGLGGVKKVQTPLEAFPSSKTATTMMMAHHNHHHRPLSSLPLNNDSCAAVDGDGPMSLTNHINFVSGASASASALVAAIHSGGAAASARTLQPFDISTYTTATAFKSPGVMAASLGFPFTNSQWKELERQAMIYKYMMASVPVPHDLLIPTPASRSPLDGGGFNLRLPSSTDPEPGRCKRTDGKKWRCSRDVAPNHKYCERHMNRGRPRSRKPVEVNTNSTTSNNNNQHIKRARHEHQSFPTSAVTMAISNPTIRKDGSSSQLLTSATSQPYLESSLSLDNFGVKAANFDSFSSVSSNKEPRGLEWMLKGDPISLAAPHWHPLMHDKVGLTSETSISSPTYEERPYLNSYVLHHNSGLVQHNRRPSLFLDPLVVPIDEDLQSEKRRGFIDAWSNSGTDHESNANTNKRSASSIGKLSLSSLDLSMGSGGGGSVDEEMGTTEMGLGLIMDPDGNTQNDNTKTHLANWLNPATWVASTSTPGGPLAEVLRPSTVVTATNEAASNPSSPVITQAESSSSPMATMVSSPSGVLQKTLASLSDSSSNSSPTVASSRANSEIAMLWFNQK